MSSPNSEQIDENMMDFTSVTQYAQGGTISEFVDFLKSTGQPCAISAKGTQAWLLDYRGQLLRLPLECLEPVDARQLRDLLRQHSIWAVSYMLQPDENHAPNCFDYVCRDPNYTIEKLQSYARRDIRRGFRNFTVRLCTWDELVEKGFAAQADTTSRHGYISPSPDELERMIQRQREWPFFEIWGAWHGDKLASWLQIVKIDNWAIINKVCSCTELLRLCPNNPLLYAATKRALVEEKREYVTYGLSSSQVDVNQFSMHKYKKRMGYEALPVHRKFVVHPLLQPLVGTRPASWMWEKAAALMPKFAILRKTAGLSRLLSGREKAPLAWAEDKS